MVSNVAGGLVFAKPVFTSLPCPTHTGRVRSAAQCRDRYFNSVMPREEGRPEADPDDDVSGDPNKMKKKRPKRDLPVLPSTTTLVERDKRASLGDFHRGLLQSITQTVQQ